jgi:hypothetical protein
MFSGRTPWVGAIDPTSLAVGGPKAGSGAPTSSSAQDSSSAPVIGGLSDLANALDPAKALGSLSQAITGQGNVQGFLLRALLVLGGLILLGLAVFALIESGAQSAAESPEGQAALRGVGTAAAA